MIATVKSRQRIIDHGEVYTPPALVRDMLDLPGIANECERVDSRFLEPACGNGNFLAEVLRRRLAKVDRQYRRSLVQWETNALLGLACLYGIDKLHDNVNECRDRLHVLFADAYTARFRSKVRPAVLDAARHILRCNILHGDALAMTTVPDKVRPARPLVFTEWALIGRKFKRQRFEFRDLTTPAPGKSPALFDDDVNDAGKRVFIPRAVGTPPLMPYLDLGNFAAVLE
jgi:hypothetical protein